MLTPRALVGTHNIALITLDTLRYDVAVRELAAGRTPNLAAILPAQRWEERHTPASFTYAAHHAFFAGFLPTPGRPGPPPELLRLYLFFLGRGRIRWLPNSKCGPLEKVARARS